jgi:hypothetical protein
VPSDGHRAAIRVESVAELRLVRERVIGVETCGIVAVVVVCIVVVVAVCIVVVVVVCIVVDMIEV